MSSHRFYIHIYSKTMASCSLLTQAYAEATATWLCTGCCLPKPDIESVDAHIEDSVPEGPLNFVNGCGLSLGRMSFLLALGEARIRRDLGIGQVFGPDGERLDDWVTFVGRRRLIVRGTKYVTSRVCPSCGRDVYFAMGTRYLYPMPPQDVEIFTSDLFGLIMREGTADMLGDCGDLKITRERLKVLREPRDGLPPLTF